MRIDENGMRPLLQGRDVSGAATSYPVPGFAIKKDPMKYSPIGGNLRLGITTISLPWKMDEIVLDNVVQKKPQVAGHLLKIDYNSLKPQ